MRGKESCEKKRNVFLDRTVMIVLQFTRAKEQFKNVFLPQKINAEAIGERKSVPCSTLVLKRIKKAHR